MDNFGNIETKKKVAWRKKNADVVHQPVFVIWFSKIVTLKVKVEFTSNGYILEDVFYIDDLKSSDVVLVWLKNWYIREINIL